MLLSIWGGRSVILKSINQLSTTSGLVPRRRPREFTANKENSERDDDKPSLSSFKSRKSEGREESEDSSYVLKPYRKPFDDRRPKFDRPNFNRESGDRQSRSFDASSNFRSFDKSHSFERGQKSVCRDGEIRSFNREAPKRFDTRTDSTPRRFENSRDTDESPKYQKSESSTFIKKPFVQKNNDKWSRMKDKRDEKPVPHPLMKRYDRLMKSKKDRDKEKAIIVTGLTALQACPRNSFRSILACSKETIETFHKLVKLACAVQIDYIQPSQMSDLINENNPDAIVAEVKMPVVNEFSEDLLKSHKKLIAINGIRDGANLGLLIRTAGCLNWDGVVIVGSGNVDPFNIQTIRASAGAVFKVPIFTTARIEDFEKAQIVFGEIPDKAPESSELDFDRPIVVVIGGEQNGHQQAPEALIQPHFMSIPIKESFGSLNAAIAGGILMSMINQKMSKIN